MRASYGFVVALLLVSACKTPPEVVPTKPTEPKVEAPPLALTELTADSKTLFGLTLQLRGAVSPKVSARDMTWSVKLGDRVLGSGTQAIEVAADRTFAAEFPVVWGETTADLEPLQPLTTMDLLLETQLGGHAATRSLQIRSPKLPEARMVTVQASRTGPQSIGVTFLIGLRNPNLYEVKFSNLQYQAFLAGKNVNAGTIPGGTRIPATAETQFEIPVEANPENCGKDIREIIKKAEMPWSFNGKMRYGKVELPVDLGGELKVSAE